MKNYKKISLLLLLSTAVNVNAFDPYDTSGNPSVDDIDDQSGDLRRFPQFSHAPQKTTLEKEVEKQKPTPTPQPVKRDPNPFFEKQKQLEAERKQREETARKERNAAEIERTATRLADKFCSLCEEIEQRNAEITTRNIKLQASYDAALAEIAKERNFGGYQWFGLGATAVFGAAATFLIDTEDGVKCAFVALATGFVTATSYILHRRKANREEQEFKTTHETVLENAAAATRTTVRTKDQLVQEAEAKLAQLKALPLATKDGIDNLEARLNNLKA